MKRELFGAVAVLVGISSIGDRTLAQVVPDNTIGTTVNLNGTAFEINNGMRSGNNLFHSFSQFSVPTGGAAIFNNALDVQNIFSRVTGSQLSNIDGILKTQGTANLFLMNPNGLIFGPNAKLQLGGSFLGTTANSIKFSDGVEFSATNAIGLPLLTMSVPIGLQINNTAGMIVVNGNGHNYTSNNSALAPVIRTPGMGGLEVQPEKSLILIGQGITLNGGNLIANLGQITLASLRSGTILWSEDGNLDNLQFSEAAQFAPLSLSNRSLIDVSGLNAGSVKLYGSDITLTDGSLLLSQNFGTKTGDDIIIQASDRLRLIGTNPSATVRSSIISETLGSGAGRNIQIASQQLYIADGASIFSRNYGPGKGGSITARIAGSAELSGFSSQLPQEFSSAIFTMGFGPSPAGNIHFTSQNLRQTDGGAIGAITFGSGQGGSLTVNVADEIYLARANPFLVNPSVLGATTFGAANAGILEVTARRIVLENGGRIDSSTYNSGHAGQVMVKARESILVTGTFPNSAYRSYIGGAALSADINTRQVLGLPLIPTGNGGDVLVAVPSLQITSGGVLNVRNEGSGNAGQLSVVGDRVMVEKGGQIIVDTASGSGGDITLNLSTLLLLRDKGLVSAESLGTGNGGNIMIDAPVIVGLENSDIVANAVKGKGGNIQITTQSLFGLKYRTALTPENDITASSEFGINGNVQVNTIGINPVNALNALPVDIVDSSREIADRCGAAKTSSFIATGRGGMPQNPIKKYASDRPWHDLRGLNASKLSPIQPIVSQGPIEALIEASAFQVDESGIVALVAEKTIELPATATCGIGQSY